MFVGLGWGLSVCFGWVGYCCGIVYVLCDLFCGLIMVLFVVNSVDLGSFFY